MNFPEINSLFPIETKEELLNFWHAALEYRKSHRSTERDLAHYVFVTTLEAGKRIPGYDEELDAICSEFGALEAPGWPPGWPDDQSVEPEDYADSLWVRLEKMIRNISQK
jgi:hypothetical protein